MGLEVITDEFISKLIKIKKSVENPRTRKKRESGNERATYTLYDEEGNRYDLYLRQNYYLGMSDDFSCGLSWLMTGGEYFTLIRYNGSSHIHFNKIERNRLSFICHIHKATKKYLDETGIADGFAEESSRYSTLEEALFCLIQDCNIEGLNINPMQGEFKL
ncbi:MAG TPA: hypothetical protein DD381_09395 [Lentisphaeria bacterium]|nr:MAG: hypothetical protein A2X47_11430 [Lentisphaerae bacterium GWF2_38_69]HBM16538.1 hypothetical protein [Lentisphaeria bacterium]